MKKLSSNKKLVEYVASKLMETMGYEASDSTVNIMKSENPRAKSAVKNAKIILGGIFNTMTSDGARFTQLKAVKGDHISVLDYRRRPAIWVNGLVKSVETRWREDGTTWNRYEVAVDTVSPKAKRISDVVTVSDDDIKKMD